MSVDLPVGPGVGRAALAMVVVGGGAAALVAGPYAMATGWLGDLADSKIDGFGSFAGWGLLIALLWLLLASVAGVAVGFAGAFPARILRVRARKGQAVMVMLGAALATWSLYLFWMAWAVFEQGAEVTWLSPAAVWAQFQEHLSERTSAGAGLGHAFCVVEALLVWNGVYSGLTGPLEAPFCSGCRRWTRAHEGVMHLQQPAADEDARLRTSLEAGCCEPLGELGDPEAGDARHLQIDLDVCPGCSETVYLTVISTRKPPPPPDENLVMALYSLKDLASPKKWSQVIGGGLITSIERDALVHRIAIDPRDVDRLLESRARPN